MFHFHTPIAQFKMYMIFFFFFINLYYFFIFCYTYDYYCVYTDSFSWHHSHSSNGGLASLDWQSTDNPYDGQYCAAAVLNPWQEWWFATRGSIKLPNEYFEGVSFMIRASTTWDKLQFFLQNYGDNYIVNLGTVQPL